MHTKFSYRSLNDLKVDIEKLGLDLDYISDLKSLSSPVKIGNVTVPNAMVAHPMEGGDSNEQGGPTDLTFKKYENVAAGGVGLIWLESVSTHLEGRSNPRQLYITKENIHEFKELISRIHKAAETSPIAPHKPITIIQLNHSGRYSKPTGEKAPIIASFKPELDQRLNISKETHTITTDNYLDTFVDAFVNAALLAKEAGFDGVDIKACHGYMLNELLSCFDREGKYGGSFENRTNLMLEIVDKVRVAVNDPDFIIGSRLNLYDALPESKGWGQDLTNPKEVDLKEPIRLVKELVKRGCPLINVTMGNPYFVPHINRPFNVGAYVPEEHPLIGVYRLIDATRKLQLAVPDSVVIGVGYSWLREFSPEVAAWILETGGAKMIGYGRQFIAYPDFAKDIIEKGKLEKNKACIACSKCSHLKRDIGTCGCPVRDQENYLQLYRDTYHK